MASLTDAPVAALLEAPINQEKYPFRTPGEVRRKYVITPERVRYQKQG